MGGHLRNLDFFIDDDNETVLAFYLLPKVGSIKSGDSVVGLPPPCILSWPCAMCGKRNMAFLVHICFPPFISFMASHYSHEREERTRMICIFSCFILTFCALQGKLYSCQTLLLPIILHLSVNRVLRAQIWSYKMLTLTRSRLMA